MEGEDGPIVAEFSAVIPAEGLTAMVGPSGAGKTTLLRLLNRLDDPDHGAVLLDGIDVRAHDVIALRRRVQHVGQVPVTFPGTVGDNMTIAATLDLVERQDLLERVGLPASIQDREADRLSVGEAQRLCLARALTMRPDVLVLDEPTSSLDAASKAGIEALVRSLADDGLTVVMVTHEVRQAIELADHVVEVHPCRT